MSFLFSRVCPVVFIFLLLSLGCGGLLGAGDSARPGPGSHPVGVPRSAELGPGDSLAGAPVAPPTATPWPTFTPAPTATPVPTPVPTQRPAPTATPWPRYSAEPEATVPAGSVPPVPAPTPYGKLQGGLVFLEKQALSAFWGGDLPDYLRGKEWDRMPEPARVVSTDTRYMLWVVVFDFTQAEPGYEMRGFVRWRSVPPGVAPVVMFETPITVSARSPFFYHGLGRDAPGVWRPGFYRVEFLDDRYQVVVDADFEVRS